jgi:hypothetical protein
MNGSEQESNEFCLTADKKRQGQHLKQFLSDWQSRLEYALTVCGQWQKGTVE